MYMRMRSARSPGPAASILLKASWAFVLAILHQAEGCFVVGEDLGAGVVAGGRHDSRECAGTFGICGGSGLHRVLLFLSACGSEWCNVPCVCR